MCCSSVDCDQWHYYCCTCCIPVLLRSCRATLSTTADAPVLLLLLPLLGRAASVALLLSVSNAIGVPPCGLSTPYARAVDLLPTATTAVSVSAAWALLPAISTGCRVRYSLLLCCYCTMRMLLRLLFFIILSPGTPPPRLPVSPRFPFHSAKLQTVLTFLLVHFSKDSRDTIEYTPEYMLNVYFLTLIVAL